MSWVEWKAVSGIETIEEYVCYSPTHYEYPKTRLFFGILLVFPIGHTPQKAYPLAYTRGGMPYMTVDCMSEEMESHVAAQS